VPPARGDQDAASDESEHQLNLETGGNWGKLPLRDAKSTTSEYSSSGKMKWVMGLCDQALLVPYGKLKKGCRTTTLSNLPK
jgi:hypothetical protein